jgi:hypothetical protein
MVCDLQEEATMKSVHLAWLGISVTVALGMSACEGDPAKVALVAADGGDAGQGGAGGSEEVSAGGSAVSAGAGGAGTTAGGTAGAGMLGGAPAGGTPGSAGADAGGQAPTGPSRRGYIDISITGTSDATTLDVSAELLAPAASAAQAAAVADWVAKTDARNLVGKADGCYADVAAFDDFANLPPSIDVGSGPTVSGNDTLLLQTELLDGDTALYSALENLGQLDLEAVEVGGFDDVPFLQSPFEIGVQQAGFASASFDWFTGDETFPIQLTMTASPVAGAWLVVDLGPYLCKVTPPVTAQQGFQLFVPSEIVAELPKFPLYVSGVTVDAFVAKDVPVSDGWVHVTTHFRQLTYYANGLIDEPQARRRDEKQRQP